MKNKYTVAGFSNGITKVTDRHGLVCYVDEDMTTWWPVGQTVEIEEFQIVPPGSPSEFSKLHEKYVGTENIQ